MQLIWMSLIKLGLSLRLSQKDHIKTWVEIGSEDQSTEASPRIRINGRWWLWSTKRKYTWEPFRVRSMQLNSMTTSPSYLRVWAQRPTSAVMCISSNKSSKTTILMMNIIIQAPEHLAWALPTARSQLWTIQCSKQIKITSKPCKTVKCVMV